MDLVVTETTGGVVDSPGVIGVIGSSTRRDVAVKAGAGVALVKWRRKTGLRCTVKVCSAELIADGVPSGSQVPDWNVNCLATREPRLTRSLSSERALGLSAGLIRAWEPV